MEDKTKFLIVAIVIITIILFGKNLGINNFSISEGNTKSVICNNNLDCSDNNQNTPDLCINPGKISSYCKTNNLSP